MNRQEEIDRWRERGHLDIDPGMLVTARGRRVLAESFVAIARRKNPIWPFVSVASRSRWERVRRALGLR